MSTSQPPPRPDDPTVYPESDGLPMAENTEQADFIVLVRTNLDACLDHFVASDHLWYPVQFHPEIRVAPDVYVAVGRPKGKRGAYLQWMEGDQPPTVVFEWWSPGNTFADQARKLLFYNRYGVDEFYTFDERTRTLQAFHRAPGGDLEPVDVSDGVTSPRLGFRVWEEGGHPRFVRPDGTPFLTLPEVEAQRDAATAERDAATAERDAALAEVERLRAQLAALQGD